MSWYSSVNQQQQTPGALWFGAHVNNFDLTGSAFVHVYVSGGLAVLQ